MKASRIQSLSLIASAITPLVTQEKGITIIANKMNYQPDTEMPEPIEQTKTPKRNLQFRSTARAWHSKYTRHTGVKQFRKAFAKRIATMDGLDLLGFYEYATTDEDINPRLKDASIEMLTEAMGKQGVSIPQPEVVND